jgi:hypothetical protein
MKIAITAYVDNQNHFVDECNLMTWSGRNLDSRFTFVIYSHPDVIDKIDTRHNVKVFSYLIPDDKYYNDYKFARSMVFPYDYADPLNSYDYILKTDTDALIGPELCNFPFEKNKIFIGRGYYSHGENMEKDMTKIAKEFGYPEYKRINDMHSTIVCEKDIMLKVMRLADQLGRLMYYNLEEDGEWSKSIFRGTVGLNNGICSMYSLEIILSSLFDESNILITNKLDRPSNWNSEVEGAYHIHCFHCDDVYSKFKARTGEYHNYNSSDTKTVSGYSLNEHISRIKQGMDTPENFNKPYWSYLG